MTDVDLHTRLGELLVDEPVMTQDSAHDLTRGRRATRRRKAAVGMGGVACLAVATLGAASVVPQDGPDQPVAAAQLSGSQILTRCREAKGNGVLDPKLFGPASRVVTAASSGSGTTAVVLSGDQKYWAECGLISRPQAEFSSAITQFSMRPTESGLSEGTYELTPSSFEATYRFPAVVGEVQLGFRDGPTLTASAVDGFAVFNSDDAYFEGGPSNDQIALISVTLRDQHGQVLASAPLDRLPAKYRPLDFGEPVY